MSKARQTLVKVVKVNRKTFFNPSGWLDLDSLASLNNIIVDTIRAAFYLPKPNPNAKPATFEEVVKRNNLSKAALEKDRKSYKSFAIILVVLGLLDFFYGFFLLFGHRSLAGFILAMVTSALFLAQAFRFDFWAMQIARRDLSLTFTDWKTHYLGTGK